jgi:rhodanese-related sulfurtransferase
MQSILIAFTLLFVFAAATSSPTLHAQQAQGAPAALKPLIPVAEAHARARSGEIVLVDIRTPEEWKETGVPESAHAITMHQDPRAFTQKILAAMGGDRTRPVALICRTGNGSSNLLAQMRRAGFTNVADVGEGMGGSRHGKGWLKSGLPVRPGSRAGAAPAVEQKAMGK